MATSLAPRDPLVSRQTQTRTEGRRVVVEGVVQGVGFRPFVHRTALALGLTGTVRNDGTRVVIETAGDARALDALQRALAEGAPPLARVERIVAQPISGEDVHREGFVVAASTVAEASHGTGVRLTADAGICERCEHELLDGHDRRYRHAFISCTDCGPRWSMLEALPYDRVRTSMHGFALCEPCAREYDSPESRRYHAESICCPRCGPTLEAFRADGALAGVRDDAIASAVATIREGGIVALHGIGGFHLAVDATNLAAVRRLRARKQRPAKPFAVMVRTVEEARALVTLDEASAALLRCAERPVVIAPLRARHRVADDVAPGLAELGVMLPSTAIQHLLLHDVRVPLVMTSGNSSGEPLAASVAEAWRDLAAIADLLLVHDRPVVAPSDDTVIRCAPHGALFMRRARGWSPGRITLPVSAPRPVLGIGADLKGTVSLADGAAAWLSPHLGDQAALAVQERTRDTVRRFIELSRCMPAVIALDAHPGYASRAMVERWLAGADAAPWDMSGSRPALHSVQHHHAHVAAVMVEHGITHPVVALAFDGAGWGTDGTVWGGEVLVADLVRMRRVGAVAEGALIGGDLAAREPWRAALGWLHDLPGDAFAAATAQVPDAHVQLARQLALRGSTARTSSMGRLFDAAAAVLGVVHRNSYEGEAAARLEALAHGFDIRAGTSFEMIEDSGCWRLDPRSSLERLAAHRRRGVPLAVMAAQWHDDVIATAVRAACRAVDEYRSALPSHASVVMCGGVFQNVRLAHGVRDELSRRGLTVLAARTLPTNDGAISVGQVAIAAAQLGAAQRAADFTFTVAGSAR